MAHYLLLLGALALPTPLPVADQVDYLRVIVNQLRKKIETKPSSPTHLLTEPWVGYRLYLPSEPR